MIANINIDTSMVLFFIGIIGFIAQIITYSSYYWKLSERILLVETKVNTLETIMPEIKKILEKINAIETEVKLLVSREKN